MRFLLAQYYAGPEGSVPIWEWDPADVTAHIDWQHRTNDALVASGELVEAQALAGPEAAKTVRSTGPNATQIIDGPFPESKEFLAGWRIIDVETEARAYEIAALTSACPGSKGEPMGIDIEVRQIMGAPDPEV